MMRHISNLTNVTHAAESQTFSKAFSQKGDSRDAHAQTLTIDTPQHGHGLPQVAVAPGIGAVREQQHDLTNVCLRKLIPCNAVCREVDRGQHRRLTAVDVKVIYGGS